MNKSTKDRLEALVKDAPVGVNADPWEDATIDDALLYVQDNLPPITRNTAAYKYKYAPLEHILDALRPLLGTTRLRLRFDHQVEDGLFWTFARVLHTPTGEVETAAFPIPIHTEGNPAQDMGKMATYARRYATLSLFGIAPADEDDDAQGLEKRQAPAPTGQDPRRTPPQKAAPAPKDGGQQVIAGAVLEVKRGLWRGVTKKGPSELCAIQIEDTDGQVYDTAAFVPESEHVVQTAENHVGTPTQVKALIRPNPKKEGKWLLDDILAAEPDDDGMPF